MPTTGELEALEDAHAQIGETLADDQRHLNEIVALSTKVRRVTSARSVLNGVAFERCPRCTQALPERPPLDCPVCGQAEPSPESVGDAIVSTRGDLDARTKELREMIAKQQTQRRNLQRRDNELTEQKAGVDRQLSEAFRAYDPASLASIIGLEREAAGYEQEAKYVEKLGAFLTRADALRKEGERLLAEEQNIGRELRATREAAQRDTENLKKPTRLFADCLVRAKLSGFNADDTMVMDRPWYLPEVIEADTGDIATIQFETLGSGGTKTLFKACFLLAIHRLAAQLKASLPTLIIIDSPMKNSSARENENQFVGFHSLVYELAEGELAETQLILIDKEHYPPGRDLGRTLLIRHMTTDDEAFPPLIRYYRAGRGSQAEGGATEAL